MILKKLVVHNFRSFNDREFVLSPRLTVVTGHNSRGKTNMLEAVYFTLNGLGFREDKEEELMRFDTDQTSVEGIFDNKGREDAYEIDIRERSGLTVKTYFVNKTSKRRDFYTKSLLKAVLFTPDQINIIKGSPSLRREYFNRLLSSIDLNYKKRLTNYEMALRRRNKVLEKHVSVEALREELKFWNDYLINESKYVVEKRAEYIDYLNANQKLDSRIFSIKYLKNEFTKDKLNEAFEKERIIRKTMIGPQKDDFQIEISNGKESKDVHRYASRSEERLAVFWLKLNEVKYFESTGIKPILLLDDIFSELDFDNKKIVLGLVESYQTVATTTEEELADVIKAEKKVIKL